MDLRYPIGKFQWSGANSAEDRERYLTEIASLPSQLNETVTTSDDVLLNEPYRPEGWTVRQLIHHIADSHMNAYIRVRLALTEDEPTIKPYQEKRWAELDDAKLAPVDTSLALIGAMHDRWVRLLRSLGEAEWGRMLIHPENGPMSLDKLLAMYAWHGKHHLAHISELRKRMSS